MSVKITFHGHSTFSIESDGHKLVVDPFFSPNNPAATVTAADVEADFILISHGHGDHIADAVGLAGRTGAQVICNFEIVGWLGNQGIENAHPLHIGGGNPGGFLLKLNNGKTIYYAGDTALTYDMKWLADEGVDLAILPIGDNFTMGPDDALKAVKLVEPKTVIPCHYGTWPYIEIDAEDFQARCHAETDATCILLSAEESHALD